ncbi:MAG: hypothetical protein FJ087_14750 [Deltaproteobacteria bacterium]|nr:hypothetical protein [Deltaproteobacteria bacterium]
MAGTDLTAIAGQKWTGGRQSLARFARLLGIEVVADTFPVTAVAWVEDHVEVRAGPPDAEVTFHLGPAVEGAPAFLVEGGLAVSYSGGDIPPLVATLLQRRCRPRLARATMDDVARAIRIDPDVAPVKPPPKRTRPAGQLDSWGVDDTWADFFAAGEVARARLDSLDPKRLFLAVQHCDAECSQSFPHGPALVSAVDYPWEDRVRRPRPAPGATPAPGTSPEEQAAPFRFHMITDLDEQDVVRGNPGKLREFVEYAVTAPNPERKTILFSNTCLPAVTGEDVESVVREYARKIDVPLLYLTVTPRSMRDLFGGLMDVRRQGVAEAPPPDPRAVNLVGFPEAAATAELSDALAAAGVRVNCLLVPEVDTDRLRRMAGAGLDVYLPNRLWDNLYDPLREAGGGRWIAPPAPYGREGTLAWVEAVAVEAGVPREDARARVIAWAAAHDGAWTAAIAAASGHRLGLALRGRDLHFLTDPTDMWGIPMLAVLEEAGFGLDLLILLTDPEDARSKDAAVRALVRDPSRVTVTPFDSLAALRERLAASPCEAVLSAHSFDWRLTEAGKNRFSLQHFEPGLSGAIRTAHRLARACAAPFFKQYRRFLARTPEGLRTA